MNHNKPGAFVETPDGTIMPDANDQAMAGRMHTGPGLVADKSPKKAVKEVADVPEK